jgi:hypothetical protein
VDLSIIVDPFSGISLTLFDRFVSIGKNKICKLAGKSPHFRFNIGKSVGFISESSGPNKGPATQGA